MVQEKAKLENIIVIDNVDRWIPQHILQWKLVAYQYHQMFEKV